MSVTVRPDPHARSSGDVQIPRLREWRTRRALSQEELAKLAKVSRSAIIQIEGGRDAWPQTVRKLAKALRIDPAELQ